MRTLVAVLGVTLTACGGGGSSGDPDGTGFRYGAEETPTAAEATAGLQAAAAAVGTMGLAGQAGTPAAPGGAHALATSALATAGALRGGAVFASAAELAPAVIARLDAALLQRDLAADWTQDCWTATASQIALDACLLPLDGSGSGILTGALTLSGPFDLAPGLVTWDATVDAQLDLGSGFSATGSEDLKGSVAWTDTTLSGSSRVDVSLFVLSYGQGEPGQGRQGWHEWHQFWRGVTYDTDYDLTYAPASVCSSRVVAGTITVKRRWTATPPMAPGDAFTDASIRFTWSGCGDVSTNLTVARSWAPS